MVGGTADVIDFLSNLAQIIQWRTYWRAAFYKLPAERRPLYFEFWAILQLFKMVPYHFFQVTFFAVPYLWNKYGTALAGL